MGLLDPYLKCATKGKVFPCSGHEGLWGGGSRGEAPFIPSALGGGKWSPSHPGRFTPDKEHLYTLHWWLDGPQWRSGRFEEEKDFLALSGFELRIVQPVV